MNSVALIGRWTHDVELKWTQSGKAVATGTLAVNDGNEADFPRIVMWEKTAENTTNMCGQKGCRVGIVGRIKTRTYEKQDGSKQSVTEVVAMRVDFLDQREDKPTASMGSESKFESEDEPPF